MRHKPVRTCLLITAVFSSLAGCLKHPEPEGGDEEAAIRAMIAQRLEQIQTGPDLDSKVAAYMSVVADDAVWMPPNSPPVEGPDAIKAWARSFFGSYVLAVDTLPSSVIELGPKLAIHRFRSVGNYILTGEGEAVPYDQKYMDHLRKTEDGTWEIVVHMWSPNDTGPTIWH